MPITNKGKEKVQLQWDGKDYLEVDGKRMALIVHPGETLSFASGMEEVFVNQHPDIEMVDAGRPSDLVCGICGFKGKSVFGLQTHIRGKHKIA